MISCHWQCVANKKKEGAKSHQSYSEEDLVHALTAIENKEMSIREASKHFSVPK